MLGARSVAQQRVLRGARHVADAALPGRPAGQELGALRLAGAGAPRSARGRCLVVEEALGRIAARLGHALCILLMLRHALVVGLHGRGSKRQQGVRAVPGHLGNGAPRGAMELGEVQQHR